MNDREGHDHKHKHGHSHAALDPSILSTEHGIRAVQGSALGMLATGILQALIVSFSGSVSLLADAIHNLADAGTSVPLWVAFRLGTKPPNKRYTYGYARAEDLAGLLIIGIILASAILAAGVSLSRLLNPHPLVHLKWVALASLIGFAGNEAAAYYRIKVGRAMGSEALIADGIHARADGLTSLAVLLGVAGAALGYPMADAWVGLGIAVMILRITWPSANALISRFMDAVDPAIVDEMRHIIRNVSEVQDVSEIRIRWLGHRLHAEANIAVVPTLSVEESHQIALEVRHDLLHRLRYLSHVTIHVDPANASGEVHHCITDHDHDNLAGHSH